MDPDPDCCSPEARKRVKRDLREIAKSSPWGISVSHDEENYMKVHCIIEGPQGTPYEKGFFYFVVTFPNDYPMSSPSVVFMTTDAGRVRFNPNLYQSGKVCLSILGTWPGPSWSPQLSLSSLLISIQSLLCENPYHNEPGYDKEACPGDSQRYNNIIHHETLRVAVCGMVLNKSHLAIPRSLVEIMKIKFMTYFEFYQQTALVNYNLTGLKMNSPFPTQATHLNVFAYDEILEELYHIRTNFVST